jgi:hypothetical protein
MKTVHERMMTSERILWLLLDVNYQRGKARGGRLALEECMGKLLVLAAENLEWKPTERTFEELRAYLNSQRWSI